MLAGKFETLLKGKSRPPLSDGDRERLRYLDEVYPSPTDNYTERYNQWLYLSQCRSENETRPIEPTTPLEVVSIQPETVAQGEPQQCAKIAHMLKAFSVPISVRRANQVLGAAGIIHELVRPGTKNPKEFKNFKILSQLGLSYGKNVPAFHPAETEIVYYFSTFRDLADKYLIDK